VEAIAKEMNVSVEDVVFALDAIQDPVSLYEPVYHDGADAIYVMDQLQDKNGADEMWLEGIALKEAIDKLGERERKIITMRFYQGKTQMEVSEEIGISQAQVSRLEKNALKSIRRSL
jgi:RNA polymerase sporulation-specific sigma factor